jgi:DNA-directed RNA polymerase subunit D
MKITNYKREGQTISFNISGVEVGMLNAFRRTIIGRVPSMAVDKVLVYNNSSILNDEFLLHRVGLVPLKTDLKTYNPQAQCKCAGEGCARCVCKVTMDVTGPRTVYSSDMVSQDENVKPVYDNIPLVKLLGDQKIKFEADAVLGFGCEHSKWQPGIAGYEDRGDGTYHVLVESYGPFPVDELVRHAFNVVGEKVKGIKSQLK